MVYSDDNHIRRAQLSALLSAALAACAFLVDLQTPLGVAGGVPLVAAVAGSVWTGSLGVWRAVVICLLLNALGAFITAGGQLDVLALVNRGYAGLGIVVTGLLAAHISRVERASKTDPLTGLLNRRGLDAELRARPGEHRVAVVVDLDNFKQVNDIWGHHAGDRGLREAAERLVSVARPADLVGRWGGDEFVVMLSCIELAQARNVVDRFHRILSGARVEVDDDGRYFKLDASLGLASSPRPHEAIKLAAEALHDAKASAGKNTVAVCGLDGKVVTRCKSVPPPPIQAVRSL